MCERRFDLGASPGVRPDQPALHGAGVRPTFHDYAAEQVLEPGEPGERLGGGRVEKFVRRARRDDRPRVEEDEPFAERERLAMRVRDVENRDAHARRSRRAGRR